jgi:ABC-type lipoprotein export system ATPase subunit
LSLSKKYKIAKMLTKIKDLTLEVDEGEFVAICGPSDVG